MPGNPQRRIPDASPPSPSTTACTPSQDDTRGRRRVVTSWMTDLPGLVPRIVSNAIAVAGMRYPACPADIAAPANIAAIGITRRCAPHLPVLACRTDIGGCDSSGRADRLRICGRRCSNCRLGCANGNNHQTRKAAGADDRWEREFLRRHGIVLFVARPLGLVASDETDIGAHMPVTTVMLVTRP